MRWCFRRCYRSYSVHRVGAVVAKMFLDLCYFFFGDFGIRCIAIASRRVACWCSGSNQKHIRPLKLSPIEHFRDPYVPDVFGVCFRLRT